MTKANVRSTVLSMANHWKVLVAVFVLSILIPAGIFWLMEPVTLIESIEWSVYLITSTGLGAYKATFLVTQIVSIFQMLWGPVMLMAIVTAGIVNYLRVDPDAWTHEEQVELLEESEEQTLALREVLAWIKEQKEKESNA